MRGRTFWPSQNRWSFEISRYWFWCIVRVPHALALIDGFGSTRTWLSNNLLYNNVEAQNVKKIRTFVATSSASENQKYNNISASCPTNNNFSLRFAIISVAFNCNMRRFWRRGGFFFCILVVTTFCSLFWMVVLLYFIPTLDPCHSRESSERNGSTDILINRYVRRLMRKK